LCCTLPIVTLAKGHRESATWHDLYVKTAGPVTLTLKRDLATGLPDPNPANDVASFTLTPQIGRCTSPVPTSDQSDRVLGTRGGEVVNSGAGDDSVPVGTARTASTAGQARIRSLGAPAPICSGAGREPTRSPADRVRIRSPADRDRTSSTSRTASATL
jgi:hypothetical protein